MYKCIFVLPLRWRNLSTSAFLKAYYVYQEFLKLRRYSPPNINTGALSLSYTQADCEINSNISLLCSKSRENYYRTRKQNKTVTRRWSVIYNAQTKCRQHSQQHLKSTAVNE